MFPILLYTDGNKQVTFLEFNLTIYVLQNQHLICFSNHISSQLIFNFSKKRFDNNEKNIILNYIEIVL